MNEACPTQNGNILIYKQMVGNTAIDCAEYTMCKFTSESAAEFVALELLLNWNKDQSSPILRPEMNKVGISLMAHKKQENLF